MQKLYGLIGDTLKHSLSPKIHSLIFKEFDINGTYELFEVKSEMLSTTIKHLKEKNAIGVNVTIPHKIEIMQYLDHISVEASKIGSVNTIAIGDNIIGYNTDYFGFGIMLEKHLVSVNGKSAIILGSGGAARSVVQYFIDSGVSDISIVSRHPKNDKSRFSSDIKLLDYNTLCNTSCGDIIVNCTPCGMYPSVDISPVERDIISRFDVAIDLIYNPKETLFLRYAQEANIKNINGLYMLVAQAAAAYRFWNNLNINIKTIDRIYESIDSLLDKK